MLRPSTHPTDVCYLILKNKFMKKKPFDGFVLHKNDLWKTFLIMKLTMFFLFCFLQKIFYWIFTLCSHLLNFLFFKLFSCRFSFNIHRNRCVVNKYYFIFFLLFPRHIACCLITLGKKIFVYHMYFFHLSTQISLQQLSFSGYTVIFRLYSHVFL